MNKEKKWYFVLILIITALIYKQNLGLNMFLISCFSIGYLSFFNEQYKSKLWWLSGFLWIGSGLSIFLSETYIGGVLYVITAINFVAVNHNQKYSFPYTLSHTFFSFILGIVRFITQKPVIETENLEVETGKIDTKILKKLFLYGIPLLLIILFLKLYQSANPTFAKYTEFLNLKFIDWQFILLYSVLMFFLYGIYLFNSYQNSSFWDLGKSNIIKPDYSDAVQTKMGIDTERKMAVMTVSVLNILLIAFVIIDGITLFSNNIDSELTHSETVHQGINILIVSIVLVIFCVGFIFRGALNFTQSKTIKILTSVWLFLNVIITILNSIKNFNYINEWGLTHKRIGVYIYLALCIIGLIFTLYKILNQKSFIFLVRRVSYSFTITLLLFSLFNWNSIIANFNLNDKHFNESQIDFYYNFNLGTEAYPGLINYFSKHPKANIEIYKRLDYIITNHPLSITNDWKTFPSIKWSNYIVEKQLKKYVPMKDNDFIPNNRWND